MNGVVFCCVAQSLYFDSCMNDYSCHSFDGVWAQLSSFATVSVVANSEIQEKRGVSNSNPAFSSVSLTQRRNAFCRNLCFIFAQKRWRGCVFRFVLG